MSETPAAYTTVTRPFPYPNPVTWAALYDTPKTFGIDLSRYQTHPVKGNTVDYHQCFLDGVKFAAIRCTVGDYYTDPFFAEFWEGFGDAGILRTPYLVVAPAWSSEYGYHPVGAVAHWERFIASFGDRVPDYPIVLDCELERGMSPDYISDLYVDLIDIVHTHFGRFPIIYTRGNWWNENTLPRALFGMCDLWVARYNTAISTPWSDNDRYRPRDWEDWQFWQWSEEHQIDGIPDSNVDADWFNGTLEELLQYADNEPITDPDPDPDTDYLYDARVVNCSQLRIRSAPTYPAYNAGHVGWMFAGMNVRVFEEVETDNGSICCRIGGPEMWAWRYYNGATYLEIE